MGYFEDELKKDLDYLIESNEITLDFDYLKYFHKLTDFFPPMMNRLDWNKIEILQVDYAPPERKSGNLTESVFKKRINTFLVKMERIIKIKDSDEIFFFGDNIELAVILKFYEFRKNFDKLLTIPQHSYVVPPNFKWCFNYTFEDDIYLGCSTAGSSKK